MKRITKADLETRIDILNTLCVSKDINKSYQIGYRNDMCYLDKKSNRHKYCINRSVVFGTKRQVNDAIYVMIEILR